MTAVAPDLRFDIAGRDQTHAAFESATRRARQFNSAVGDAAPAFNAVAAAARQFSGVIAGIGFAGALRGVRDVVAEASELAKVADKVGLATDEFQTLQYGFGQAGVSAAEFERGLEQWSKRISEAAAYGGRLADILDANGVAIRDTNGNLRSSVDLMRDYAELVRGATSNQDKMALSTEAFGRSASAFVLAFRDGAAGIDRMQEHAASTGVVIEERLLRRAEKLDDKLGDIATTLSVRVKRGVLSVADEFERLASGPLGDVFELMQRADRMAQSFGQFAARLSLNDDIYRMLAPAPPPVSQKELGIDMRIASTLNAPVAVPETKIPGKGATGDGSVGESPLRTIPKQLDAYAEIEQALLAEWAALGKTATEQRVMNELRAAGVEAGSAQGQAIRALVVEIDAEKERMTALKAEQDAFNEAAMYAGQIGLDAFSQWAGGAQTAEEALRTLTAQLAEAALQAALFGQGPLAGLFTGGGLFTTLTGSVTGKRAAGGPVNPYGAYVVGEKGPELLRMGSRGGEVISNGNAFGGSTADRGELVIRLGEGLKAEWLQNSENIAVRVVQSAAPQIASAGANQAIREIVTPSGNTGRAFQQVYNIRPRTVRSG